MMRNPSGVLEFVVVGAIWIATGDHHVRSVQTGDERRIQSARKEDPHRHVAAQAEPDRVLQKPAELLHIMILFLVGTVGGGNLPVPADLGRPAVIAEKTAGRNCPDTLEERILA